MSSPFVSRAPKEAVMKTTKKIIKPPRRYTIGELLHMGDTLPCVSCPLRSFTADAWRENLVNTNVKTLMNEKNRSARLPPTTIKQNLPYTNHPDPPVRPLYTAVPDTANTAPAVPQQRVGQQHPLPFADGTGEVFPSERRRPPELGKYPPNYPAPNRLETAAHRQPMNPGQAENRGFLPRSSSVSQQQFLHLYGPPGMEVMEGPPASGGTSYAGVDPRAYAAAYAAQQNGLRVLQAMGHLSLQGLPHSPPQASRVPYTHDFGGYGSAASRYTNTDRHISQGFVPGGNLKTAPTTGLSPTHEYTGINWESSTGSSSTQQQAFDKWAKTTDGEAYYSHITQQESPRANNENFSSGLAYAPERTQQFVSNGSQRDPRENLHHQQLNMLNTRPDRDDQLAFIQIMMSRAPSGTRTPYGTSSRGGSSSQHGSMGPGNGANWQ